MTLTITPVLCNEKNMQNNAYILSSDTTSDVIIIDAAEFSPIEAKLEELHLTPTHILTTHHHFDHVEANLALKEKYNVRIIAPEKEFDKVPGADIKAVDGQDITIGELTFKVIAAPGHTLGHVLYYLPKEQALFTGDVLFNLCVGGLFEGTAEQMFTSLAKIKSLPDDTRIFAGHEYTRACLSRQMLQNPEAQTYITKMLSREQGLLAPATLGEEKTFNPYLQTQTLSEFLGL
jgi:hydroxyacylglutathione hydrolase